MYQLRVVNILQRDFLFISSTNDIGLAAALLFPNNLQHLNSIDTTKKFMFIEKQYIDLESIDSNYKNTSDISTPVSPEMLGQFQRDMYDPNIDKPILAFHPVIPFNTDIVEIK